VKKWGSNMCGGGLYDLNDLLKLLTLVNFIFKSLISSAVITY